MNTPKRTVSRKEGRAKLRNQKRDRFPCLNNKTAMHKAGWLVFFLMNVSLSQSCLAPRKNKPEKIAPAASIAATADSIPVMDKRLLQTIDRKTIVYYKAVADKTERTLVRLARWENKLQKLLSRVDPGSTNYLFTEDQLSFTKLLAQYREGKRATDKVSGAYDAYRDTVTTALLFFNQQNSPLSPAQKELVTKATVSNKQLTTELVNAQLLEQHLKERRKVLVQQSIQLLGRHKYLRKISKESWYYTASLQEYKQLFSDRRKAEQKAITLLSKTKLFKDFMRKHSQLASLFRLPGDPNDPATLAPNLAGLQTRAQVNNLIQQQLAAGGPGAQAQFRQNMQDAQAQLNQLKEKLLKFPGSNSTDGAAMPEGFKPNQQKTKSFLKRIELGVNIQSQKSNGYLPVTSDIGLSAGYKLNDKSIIGIGMSYKVGWGESIRKMKVTHQGMSIRSFIDWKIKGSFWLTGGYEWNYRPALAGTRFINPLGINSNSNGWQESGLLGVSKQVSLKTKFFKQTKLQLLWDFLSYRQVPKTPAMVFRVGYGF